MSIPVPVLGGRTWAELDAAGKRERLLRAATDLFTRRGVEAPMSDVADAAGAGVASVYRIFASKEELLAALMARRWDEVHDAAVEAEARAGTRWAALTQMIATLVERQSAHDFLGEARVTLAEHPEVVRARVR